MRSYLPFLLTLVLVTASIPWQPARVLAEPGNAWTKLTDNRTGRREGSVLLAGPDSSQMLLLGGTVTGVPYVQSFNTAERTWSEFSTATPEARRGMHPYYQAVHDAAGQRLICVDAGKIFTFDLVSKSWSDPLTVPVLEGMSWHAISLDPDLRKLVIIGADKKLNHLGWTRTVIWDLATDNWSRLPLPSAVTCLEHRALLSAGEALTELVGRIRLAWYRDPQGVGSESELRELAARCALLKTLPGTAKFADEVDQVALLIAGRKTLDALTASRTIQRKLDVATDLQYPVPLSRRNAPLVFDAKHKVFVLFGGDHEDYTLNDTWVLDLAKPAWRRGAPDVAPSPRAGHALVFLPGSGKIVMLGGYVASSSSDYRSRPWSLVQPPQLWLYDTGADRWDLLARGDAQRDDAPLPPPVGHFYGYSAQWFSPPAIASDDQDRLVLEVTATERRPSSTWTLAVDATRFDAPGREKLGAAPNQRRRRDGRFTAAYCEVPDEPEPTTLANLPPNQWTQLPDPPRNVAYGCRQRDWSTSTWDSVNEQILLFGGGHCIRSASTPIHYSPISGRMVEGYDADEPYGYNGGGGFGSSVLNRPWCGTHGYNHYAFDPRCGLLVAAQGFLYDPKRMDWLRLEPLERPFHFHWAHTVLEASPHGVVAWADSATTGEPGLWLFDRDQGWIDLEPDGSLFQPYCDSEGMTYDAKRDRMLLGFGGGYAKKGDGSLTAFSFATRKLTRLSPRNAELGQMVNTREMVYLDHADWVLFAEALADGNEDTGHRYTRVYDCARNTYFLLDAGAHPPGKVHSQGWVYDAPRRLVYVFTVRGQAYALRLEPETAKRMAVAPR